MMSLDFFMKRERIERKRREYYSGVRKRADAVQETVDAWRRLQELRRTQGFTSTTCKLTSRKKKDAHDAGDADPCRRRHRWDEEIRRQVHEKRLDFQQRCQNQRQQYKSLKAQWKLSVTISTLTGLPVLNFNIFHHLNSNFNHQRIPEEGENGQWSRI